MNELDICPGCFHNGISSSWTQGIRYDYCPECGLTASPLILSLMQRRYSQLRIVYEAAREFCRLNALPYTVELDGSEFEKAQVALAAAVRAVEEET